MDLNKFEKIINIKNKNTVHDLKYEIGTLVLFERIQSGLSQADLAKKIKTQQPGIARIESGRTLPSLTFLEKIANAIDMYVNVTFVKATTKQIKVVANISPRLQSTESNILSMYFQPQSQTKAGVKLLEANADTESPSKITSTNNNY